MDYFRRVHHYESFIRRIEKDRDDGTFCDLEIDCGERRFRAHRNVVCLRSPVIRAAFLRKWKKEPACAVFEIKQASHVLVRRMLDYIYTGDYDDFDSRTLVQKDHLSPLDALKLEMDRHLPLHVKMMELGDTYLIEGLNQLTSEKCTKYFTSLTTSKYISAIVPEVYALVCGPAHVIRECVIQDMREKLLQRPWAADINRLWGKLIRDVPEFTRDLLKSYMDRPFGRYQRVKTAPAQEHDRGFVRSMVKDRDDEVFCDLEIVCGERRFPSHRNVEAACGVFEIKETSHLLVRRMIDYIYTGDYDNFDSSILVQKNHLSTQDVAVFDNDIADYLTLHTKMMELGDMYMVEGLSQRTIEKLAEHLESQTARDILVTIVPEVYALKTNSSEKIRKVVTECIRRKMSRLPLADDVEESLEGVAKNVPEFTCELLKSYMKIRIDTYDDDY
ncbi:hypothetical protein E4U09_007584 [Claviceps aff. purpurea]|uniref:BTB domain-containing protein n=1 Tax=Claviceps aff. purpurea TaxID=1967640 RepID=A0A9P7Q9W4_9HYPO|nr:hypothetical protein E4U09_007584 [Claviceps aff. purpurea]